MAYPDLKERSQKYIHMSEGELGEIVNRLLDQVEKRKENGLQGEEMLEVLAEMIAAANVRYLKLIAQSAMDSTLLKALQSKQYGE